MEGFAIIIDAHNHPLFLGHSCAQTLQNMAECGIDRMWLLTLETPEDEFPPDYYRGAWPDNSVAIPLASCLAYKQAAPDKFILGYAPDPRKPFALERLQSAVELFGVQVCGEFMLRMTYDDPDALRMFRYCGKAGLPVIVELNYGVDRYENHSRPNYWYGGGIEAFERAVQLCPETTFLGHGTGFWAHISGDDLFDKTNYPNGKLLPDGKLVDMMRRYPNLYCDLSAGSGLNALQRDEKFAAQFLLEFQDRALYGRDVFHNRLQQFLNGLGLPDHVLHKIYSGNASRLLGEETTG